MNAMNAKPECYGKIFPDLADVVFNRPLSGKAFSIEVESGGMGISGRSLSVDPAQWSECTHCQSYRECYDLSVATLLLHGVVQGYGVAPAI